MPAAPERQPAETPVTPTGLLVIDKPISWTSMGVCARVRNRLRAGGAPKRNKVGHAGTLDPLASGVLVVLVGRATRLSGTIMGGVKRYTTTIDLSRTSDSFDLEGETTPVPVEFDPAPELVRTACTRFVGNIDQAPPAHSAMKVEGRRAYALARAGKGVEPPPRPIRIDAINIIRYDWPLLSLDITCGKGTYIRSIARDLGLALGTGGVLTELRRTRVGPFTIEHAIAPDDLPAQLTQADLLPVPDEQIL